MTSQQLHGLTLDHVNRINRLLKAFESGALTPSPAAKQPQAEQQQAKVPFINESGEEVPPFAVMAITGAQARSDTLPWALKIEKPTSTFRRLYLVNGERPVPASESGSKRYGTGTFLWHARLVRYNSSSGTPAIGEVWGPKAGQWDLEKHRFGFYMFGGGFVLGGENVCLASQHLVTSIRAKTSSTVAKNATGTVAIYDTNGTDTTNTLASVKNIYGSSISSGRWVNVTWNGDKPEMTAAEC